MGTATPGPCCRGLQDVSLNDFGTLLCTCSKSALHQFNAARSSPVYCSCMTSSVQAGIGTSTPESIRFQYVPGAGDDEETWGCGLTADMLHEHQQVGLATCSGHDLLLRLAVSICCQASADLYALTI